MRFPRTDPRNTGPFTSDEDRAWHLDVGRPATPALPPRTEGVPREKMTFRASSFVISRSDSFHFAFFDKDFQAFLAEVFEEGLGIEGFGHHDAASFELASHQQLGRQSGRDAGLDFGERVAVLLIDLAMVVHGVDEIFDALAMLGAANFG